MVVGTSGVEYQFYMAKLTLLINSLNGHDHDLHRSLRHARHMFVAYNYCFIIRHFRFVLPIRKKSSSLVRQDWRFFVSVVLEQAYHALPIIRPIP